MWTTYLLLVLIILLVALYVWGILNFDHFKARGFPYVESTVPYFGSMGPFVFNRLSITDLALDIYTRYSRYDLIGLFEFRKPVIMVRAPELIKLVTVKHFDHFVEKSNHRVVPFTEENEPLLGKTLLGLHGEKWRAMRATLSPAFTSSKMKVMFQFVEECGQQLSNFVAEKVKDNNNELLEVEMKDLFSRFANDVIATSAFGIHCDSLKDPDNEFFMMGKDVTDLGGVRALKFFGFRLSTRIMKFLGFTVMTKKSKSFLTNLILNTIHERESAGIVRPDMLHLLMEAKKGSLKHDDVASEDDTHTSSKFSAELTNEDIMAQALLFFLAGFDTASTNLCFLSNLIAVHPEVQARLQQEIDEVIAEDKGKLTYDGVVRLKYLDMCINEALRLWPPAVMTNRRCVKPYVFPATENSPSITVRVGDGIWMPIIGIQRDPKYFQDPLKFDPERFNDENKSKIKPFTYMPFGTGPRNCIGMRFAVMETKIAIASLLQRFDLKAISQTKDTEVELAKKSFNIALDGGFWLGIRPRSTSSLDA